MRFNRIFLDELYKKKHAIEAEIDRTKAIDTFDGDQSAAIHAAEARYLEEMRKTINWLITEYLETHNL